MEYHLYRNGVTEGIFPLEELRRRRMAGEIAGTDLVWRQGMADWQPLDTVLATTAPTAPRTTPPPIPAYARRKTNPWVIMGLAACGLAVLAVVAGITVVANRFNLRVQRTLHQSQRDTKESVDLAS